MKVSIILFNCMSVIFAVLILVCAFDKRWRASLDEEHPDDKEILDESVEKFATENFTLPPEQKRISPAEYFKNYTCMEDYVHDMAYKYGGKIPHFSLISDVAGMGRVTNKYIASELYKHEWDGSFVDLSVETFWRGDPGTNLFRIQVQNKTFLPEENKPVIFFLTRYGCLRGLRERKEETRYCHVTRELDYFRSIEIPDGYWFCDDRWSWFYVNETNSDFENFASNIVFAANTKDTNGVFRILRDSCINNPVESRLYFESYGLLIRAGFYFDGDFVRKEVSKDPKLPQIIRDVW